MNASNDWNDFFHLAPQTFAVTREDVRKHYSEAEVVWMEQSNLTYEQMIELHEIEQSTEALLQALSK